jgi:hypothetical protein
LLAARCAKDIVKLMNTPKGQHTVPRLHLQHFAGSEPAGQVWTYDAVESKEWSAIPEETSVQTHFYSAERDDGSMDTRLEEFLSTVESKAAPIYEQLLKGDIPGESQARFDFAQFVALMHVRTTAMRRMAAKIRGRGAQIHSYAYASNPEAFEALTRRIEEEKGEPLDPAIKEEIKREMLRPSGKFVMEVSQESTLMALSSSDKLTPILYKMKWTVVEAEHSYFITSDNPIVRWVDPKSRHPIYGDDGFLNKTAKVTFPLSPKRLLLMSWQKEVPDQAAFNREHVDYANATRAGHSERFLHAHIFDKRIKALAAKYRDSRPDVTTEGFGPETFAPIEVARRSKKKKKHSTSKP